MKLSVGAFGLAVGIIWGAGLLVVGVLNLVYPSYGLALLDMAASVYPGYHASGAIGDLVIGVLYAFVDGVVCALILALLYNMFAPKG